MPIKVVYELNFPPTALALRPTHLRSLLYLSAQSGWAEILHAMLGAGADPNMLSLFSKFPLLQTAAQNGHARAVAALLDGGADIDIRNSHNGRTALMLAAGRGHLEVVTQLLARGADIDATDNDGRTALIRAAAGQMPVTVAALLAAGANPHIREFERGRTAVECIDETAPTRAKRQQMVEAFLAYDIRPAYIPSSVAPGNTP